MDKNVITFSLNRTLVHNVSDVHTRNVYFPVLSSSPMIPRTRSLYHHVLHFPSLGPDYPPKSVSKRTQSALPGIPSLPRQDADCESSVMFSVNYFNRPTSK